MKQIISLLLFFAFVVSATAQNAPNTIIVDRNGTGHFRTIQQAIDSVRTYNPAGTVTIYIKNGFYKEKLIIPSHVCYLHIVGEDRDKTIINYDDHANINKMGTFKTFTLKISGNDIVMENLTIENSAAQLGQAVALHLEGDRITFRNCKFLGNQDTIYAGRESARQLFENCYIEGTTDFIFGPATAWFEACTIHCKRNSYITAANTPQNVTYGFIFNNCNITLADSVNAMYLGRPWRAYSMTVFMNCVLPKGIQLVGWDNWRNPENEKTARYAEFNNSGEGAITDNRAKWIKILTKKEASKITQELVFKREDSWTPTISKN
ncbi:MAG: pectinesterase family protein [Paludibacter sp.]